LHSIVRNATRAERDSQVTPTYKGPVKPFNRDYCIDFRERLGVLNHCDDRNVGIAVIHVIPDAVAALTARSGRIRKPPSSASISAGGHDLFGNC
jgi:hypothetical protein